MKKNNHKNSIISNFVLENCSPVKHERKLAQDEFYFLNKILIGSIFQSGSYARFTPISPLNDLDVIWIISKNVRKQIEASELRIENVLVDLANKIKYEYEEKGENVSVKPQSHSVIIEFLDKDNEFSIDVVPAYELLEMNEYKYFFYKIPEVGLMSRKRRDVFYKKLKDSSLMKWIKTDPKGYIEAAKQTNEKSLVFRLSTKLLKKWKRAWKNKKNFGTTEFKLQSFHIELIVQQVVSQNSNLDILDTIEAILSNISYYFSEPHFKDRAQDDDKTMRYVDEYVKELSSYEKRMILIAATSGLKIIKEIRNIDNCDDGIIELLYRFLSGEEFIDAYGYKINDDTIKDKNKFKIDGYVREKAGFPFGWLDESIPLLKGLTRGIKSRRIDFKIKIQPEGNFIAYWKVKNTGDEALKDNCLRGEINKDTTLRSPEETAYKGNHFVTCFLVDKEDNTVIAMDTIEVRII
ncbi:hypothetical protein CVT91_09165 [Candidatus Atribacteria bacterium HGW-Atribacteria-1]|nr:MAG: hypothetical protein CVT91_09165 [Candidatus Atribacteria bacterium HGW-Atribacteria-1]